MQSCTHFQGRTNESYRPPLTFDSKHPDEVQLHRLFVDSRDCIQSLTSFAFTVYLSDPFRDPSIGVAPFDRVKSVELKGLAFPKTSEDYVIMDIEELNDDTLLASNDAGNRSFAVIYFDTGSSSQLGEIRPIKGYDYYQKEIAFNPVLPSLTKLTVTFKNRDGSVITPADTGGVDRCSFMLEITTLL